MTNEPTPPEKRPALMLLERAEKMHSEMVRG